MAKYRAITSASAQSRLAKKRERICYAVDGCYAVLMIIGILIGGLHQQDPRYVGWSLIAMGILCLPVALFHIYVEARGWDPMLWGSHIFGKPSGQELEKHRLLTVIVVGILLIMGVTLPIFGTLRLLGIM